MSTSIGIIEGTIRLNDQFTANMAKTISGMLSFAAVAGATIKLFNDISQEVIEDANDHARLVAVLHSTRNASEGVAEALEGQADALSRVSTFTDNAIVQAQTIALRFTHIGNEVFPRVTQAAMDMAAATGSDVASAMESLGRSIDDPIRGLTLLRRTNVTLTDEQKEQVKHLMAHGELIKAQGVLLDALAVKYAGAAAAMRNTMGGSLTALKNSWDRLLETIGKDSTGQFRAGVELAVKAIDKINDNWHKFWMTVDVGVLDIVKKIHSLVDAWIDLDLQILNAGKSMAILAGPAGLALVAMFDKMEGAQRKTRSALDASFNAMERTIGSDIVKQILAQVDAQLALGRAANITGDGLVRLSEEEKAAGEALAAAFKQASAEVVAINAGLESLASGKSVEFSEALVAVMKQFPDASAKTIAQLVQLALNAKLAGDKFARLKDFIEKAGKGVDIASLTGVSKELAKSKFDFWFESLSDSEQFAVNIELARQRMIKLGVSTEVMDAWLAKNNRIQADITEEIVKAGSAQDHLNQMIMAQEVLVDNVFQSYMQAGMAAAGAVGDAFGDAIAQGLKEGAIDGEAIMESLVDRLINIIANMVAEIVTNWLKGELLKTAITIQQAAIRKAADSGSGGGGGGGGGWMSSIMRMFGGGSAGGGAVGGSTGFGTAGYSGLGASGTSSSGAVAAGGSSSGAAAGAGWAAAFLAVALIAFNKMAKAGTPRASQDIFFGGPQGMYTSGMPGSMTNPQGGSSANASHSMAVVLSQIQGVMKNVRDFLTALGGELDLTKQEMGNMSITKKGQGKHTQWLVRLIDGAVVNFGKDMEAAFEFATIQAIKAAPNIGLSSEIVTAIKNSTATKLDEFQKNIDTALAAVHARLGESGSALYDIFRSSVAEVASLQALGLSIDATIAKRDREAAALKNNLLGVDTAASDAIANLASFQRGIAELGDTAGAIASQAVDRARADLEAAVAAGPRTTVNRALGESHIQTQEEFDAAIARLQAEVDRYVAELDKIPVALSDQEINMGIFDALYKYLQSSGKYAAEAHKYALMKVEIEFAAIKAQLVALGKWEEFATMFDDALAAARRDAGRGPRSGRGDAQRQSRADILQEAGLFGASDITRQLADTGFWLEEFKKRVKDAGFSAAQSAALIAQGLAEVARRQAEIRQGIRDRVNQFLGVGQDPLAQLSKSLEILLKEVADGGFAADVAAGMIASLTAEYEKQADQLIEQGRDAAMAPHRAALDAAAGIGSSQRGLIDMLAAFEKSREALRKLADEARAAGRSTDFLAEDIEKLDKAQSIAARQIGAEFLGSLESLGVRLPTKVVLELAHAQFALAQAQAMSAALALAAAGAFEGLSFTLSDLLGWIRDASFEGSTFFPQMEDFSSAVGEVATGLSDLARRLIEAQDGIRDLLNEMATGAHGVVSARQAFEAQQALYQQTRDLARTGDIFAMEAIDDVGRDYLAALASFSPALLAAEFPNIQTDLQGLLGITTAHDDNLLTSTLFNAGTQQQIQATNTGFAATVAVGTEQLTTMHAMVDELGNISTHQQILNERLQLMETTMMTTKRTVMDSR